MQTFGEIAKTLTRSPLYLTGLQKRFELPIFEGAAYSPAFHVESIDLLGNGVEAEAGVAFLVACYSVLRKAPPQPGLSFSGDLSIQGNIKPVRSLVEPLQVAMDNAARKVMIPVENKRNFLEVSADIMEKVDPVFYSDPQTAVLKALSLK